MVFAKLSLPPAVVEMILDSTGFTLFVVMMVYYSEYGGK
jgi:hypothetical protein